MSGQANTASPASQSSGTKSLVGGVIITIALLLAFLEVRHQLREWKKDYKAKKEAAKIEKAEKEAARRTAPTTRTRTRAREPIYAMTPFRLDNVDYAFNIETSDREQLVVEYSDGRKILFKAPCQKLPQPYRYGPVEFTKPKGATTERYFRIYPIRSASDVPPCP